MLGKLRKIFSAQHNHFRPSIHNIAKYACKKYFIHIFLMSCYVIIFGFFQRPPSVIKCHKHFFSRPPPLYDVIKKWNLTKKNLRQNSPYHFAVESNIGFWNMRCSKTNGKSSDKKKSQNLRFFAHFFGYFAKMRIFRDTQKFLSSKCFWWKM